MMETADAVKTVIENMSHSEIKNFKLQSGGLIPIDVSPEKCVKFGGFLPKQRIKRMNRGIPKPGESWDLWKNSKALYEAIVIGVARNPTALPEYWGQECLWIQEDEKDYVICFPSNVISAEDFADIGVVAE